MSGFGIGLGAFMKSFAAARNDRLERADKEEQRQIEAEERTRNNAREDAADARTQTRFDWDQEDHTREAGDRQRVRDINTQSQEGFKKAVEAGEADPDDFMDWWTKQTLPQLVQAANDAGDTDKAQKLLEWGRSENTLKGTKLFRKALAAAQQGNASAALDFAIKAGNVDGYMDNGIEMLGHDELVDSKGNVLGYRVRMKGEDGKEKSVDIKAGDVPNVIATYANPEYAYKVSVEAAGEQAKDDREVQTYKRKKEVDAQLGTGTGAKTYSRADAIKDLEKADADSALAEGYVPFSSKSAAEKEAALTERMNFVNGGAGAPAGGATPTPNKVVVDKSSGQVVPGIGAAAPASPVPTDSQLGVGPALRSPEQEAAVNRARKNMPASGSAAVNSTGAVQEVPTERAAPSKGVVVDVRPGSKAGGQSQDRQAAIAKAVKMVREKSATAQDVANVLVDYDISGDEFKDAMKAGK